MDSYPLNTNSGSSVRDFLAGTGTVSQILLVIVLGLILYVLMMALESIYALWAQSKRTRVDAFPYRQSAQNNTETISQNPAISSSMTLFPSYNERTGMEFSYSFFLKLNSNGFTSGTKTLKHVFHKGYTKMYPLMSPGVFVHSDENTVRVYMNSTKKILNHVDIPNIPVGKWVHLVILARKNSIEIYLNGNIVKKLNVDGLPVQNYQDLILFSQRQGLRLPDPSVSATATIDITGPFNGDLASLTYFTYAMSYSEIQGINVGGPSTETKKSGSGEVSSPYLVDNWWTNPAN
jgi:hypothetical protein